MESKLPENIQERLKILRDALARIERNPDPYFNANAHQEFKRILTARIAVLERIAILESVAASEAEKPSGFRVQVYIRGVEIQSCK